MVLSKIKILVLSSAAATILAGCGDQHSEKPTDAGRAVASDSTKVAADEPVIPESVIVRIAVDNLGNPVGEPELRIAASDAQLSSETDVSQAFNGGAVGRVVSSVEELDADSSTQSWFLGNSWGRGGWGHRGGWGGWGGFGPRLGWGGGFHNYGFNQGFHFGGYRYGCFNRFGW